MVSVRRFGKLLQPNARVVDTGHVGVACRLPLSERTRGWPEHLLTRLASVLPSRDYIIVANLVRRPDAQPGSWDAPDHLIRVHVAEREVYGDWNPLEMVAGVLRFR
jgi:hypothetical protein